MRPRQVFRYIAEGYTSAQMTKSLHISKRTVDIHRANIMKN
ncbi:LuxR C-terminal-related transcriptional regulator [Desulfobacter latus]|uniref:HTH luxR-type domain-containing protein n=1 Tax=Desulfobacter latus TaxID=2292 RepID=A0A850TBP2_9BACT|nr:hypothetical protein [Desulfobacter latus]